MASIESNITWNRRPGAIMDASLRLIATLVVLLIGFALYFHDGGIYWLSIFGIAAIIMWLVTPALIRAATAAGWFGRIRLADGRLHVGRSWQIIRMDGKMSVEARLQRAARRHRFRLSAVSDSFGRSKRAETRRIAMMTVVIRQKGLTLVLAADALGSQLAAPLDLEGLYLRRVAISPPPERVAARLWPWDLIEILRALQAAPGYEAAQSSVPDTPPKDPRRPVWPLWKMIGALGVVALLWMGVVVGIRGLMVKYGAARGQAGLREERIESAFESERMEREARSAFMGERVTWKINDWRFEGRVEAVAMRERLRIVKKPYLRTETCRGPMLIVVLEAIYSSFDGPERLMGPEWEAHVRGAAEPYRLGDRLDVPPEEAHVVKEEKEPKAQ